MILVLTLFSLAGATSMFAAAYGTHRQNKRSEARSRQQELLMLEDIVKSIRLRRAFRESVGLPPDDEPATADEIELLRRRMF